MTPEVSSNKSRMLRKLIQDSYSLQGILVPTRAIHVDLIFLMLLRRLLPLVRTLSISELLYRKGS